MATDFIPGQRWISEAELQMGLGTILAVEGRSVTIVFMATGETRVYSRHSAPLSRVRFAEGDTVRAHEGWTLNVESVVETDGLLRYRGRRDDGGMAELPEGQLDNRIQLNRPGERLFSAQIDPPKWFELRRRTLEHHERLSRSDLRGLTGARTSLIPHQLYIAHEVAGRYAPRVLLADEVGLGKTIEAGLILHQQLLTGLARRVLIIVPDSLVHQWLVEMLRRFNLYFTIFDEDRCQAVEESSGQDNPFHTAQLALCSLGFISGSDKRFKQALAGNWDLLVVDEAHHLEWSPDAPSPEYQRVSMIAASTSGVLLLTATPEQLGKLSHFARLRLLDPDRFPDYDTFIAEEQRYRPVAEAVEQLLSDQAINDRTLATLRSVMDEGDDQALLSRLDETGARTELVDHLLDRHGTGRVLFRNTRAAVKGFPQRRLHSYALELPTAYAEAQDQMRGSALSEPGLLLCPELMYQACEVANQTDWTEIDPRVAWLSEQLKQLRSAKVLVITASADSAIELAAALRVREGIHAAVFHEDMSIVERDRAAAFFADPDDGSQVLICSEIGSEGRNFQFAHHLVMFDLPLNPDLLEQRIGRLDRIGQTETIRIHVPYIEGSPQELMFNWYHQGLAAFEHTCPAGHSVFSRVGETLIEALHQLDDQPTELLDLIVTTQALLREMNEALHQGRDRLLEYNSCRPHAAQAQHQQAEQADQPAVLLDYLEHVFDCYGVDMEEHSRHGFLVRPGEKLQTSFPGLLDEGMIITCERDTALSNEDMHYVTWEHPMTEGAMDMVLSSELGNATMVAVKLKGVKPGSLLLECLYVLESSARAQLQSSRHLPPSMIRSLVTADGKQLSQAIGSEAITRISEAVDGSTAGKIVRAYIDQLRDMIKLAEAEADKQVPALLAAAHRHGQQTLQREIDRLKALQRHNPNVRDEEIAFFEIQLEALSEALTNSSPRLDAIRVIVTT
ncbi:MAG: RNA polymerase-associated protein RapA [Gammaproteobacteria bacterium]|nr:RNA polymerase-associated protein RapA [Gammaproteobacteria bacterium]